MPYRTPNRLIPSVMLAGAIAAAALGLPTAAGAASSPDPGGGPILPLAQVLPGMDCTGETVVQGTSISSFDVHVIDVLDAPGEGPRILIRASGPAVDSTGIAAGFSGSPVYCPDSTGTPANAGAISESVGDYGNHLALVTPIEQMLGEPVFAPSHARLLTAPRRPLMGPLSVAGLSGGMFDVLREAASRAGRTVLAAPGDPLSTFSVQPLVPGASVGVSYSTGVVGVGAVGTVTYRNGQTVYAFGHPFDEVGRRSLPLQDAYVYDVVGNPDPLLGSYKLAAPGHVEGTLTSDTPNAVIGQVGAGPTMIPLQVNATDLDTGRAIEEATQVADETDVGSPLGTSLLGLVAPLAIGQAATDVYDGPPANESGRMCLRLTIRELGTLGFCKRYVGTGFAGGGGPGLPELATATASDAGSALALLDSEQFAPLHVTSVAATITAQGGLAEAALLSAKAPLRVKAGRTVRVHLLLRRYRGALQRVTVKLRIPRQVHGPLLVSIHGPSGPPGGANPLVIPLSLLLGAPGPSPRPPESASALRQRVTAIASYDGLEATLLGAPAPGRRPGGRPPSGRTEHVYRDPALLINGQAHLTFLVR